MPESGDYRFGSIWIVNFDPSVGTEIRKTRPALIISGSIFNLRRTKLSILPFTSIQANDNRIRAAVVEVAASKINGLSVDSLLICIDPITFDKVRFVQRIGDLETEMLKQVQGILRRYLSL